MKKTYRKRVLILVILVILIIVVALPLTAQVIDGVVGEGEYSVSQVFDGGAMTVSYTLGNGQIVMALEAETEGWVAVGFDHGTIMKDSDMVFGWVADGTASALDCYSIGPTGPHPPDIELGGQSDISAFAGSENNGYTVIEFSKPLSSNDQYDNEISEGMKIIWAYGWSDDFQEIHDRAGFAVLSGSGQSGGPSRALFLIHIIAMSLSLISVFNGMMIARYGKKNKWWLKAHRASEIGGSIFGLIGIAGGVAMVQLTKGVHLTVLHAWVALAAIIFLIATPIIAQLFLKSKLSADVKKKLRPLHRWSGRIALLLMVATVILGLFQAGIL